MKSNSFSKKSVDGEFDAQMSYGWASDASAWEPIYSKASWSINNAKAALKLIWEMEKAGINELPRASYFMREVSRVANRTIRESQIEQCLKRTGIKSFVCK